MSNNDTYTPGRARTLQCKLDAYYCAGCRCSDFRGTCTREAGAALSCTQLIPAAHNDPPHGTAEPGRQGDVVSGKVHLGRGKMYTGVTNQENKCKKQQCRH